jgi:hypothetical protein
MASPYKNKRSPLKQDNAIRHYSDSSTVYNQSMSMNDMFSAGETVTKSDYNVISNLNVKRKSEGLFKIYPLIESGVTKEHDITTTKTVKVKGGGGVEGKKIEKQYTSKNKNTTAKFNKSNQTLSVTTTKKSTEGYVIPKPKMKAVTLDPISTPSLVTEGNLELVKAKKYKLPRTEKSTAGKIIASAGALIPKLKVRFNNSGLIKGFVGVKNKGNYKGSKYKKYTEREKDIMKSINSTR